MKLLCYYIFIRSLAFIFSIITVSFCIPVSGHPPWQLKCPFVRSMVTAWSIRWDSSPFTGTLQEWGCTEPCKKLENGSLWLPFKMRLTAGMCECHLQVKWFMSLHRNLLTVLHKNANTPWTPSLGGGVNGFLLPVNKTEDREDQWILECVGAKLFSKKTNISTKKVWTCADCGT